ncbi:MAG: PilZ domain-containing protein [Promethearchaeota archaeon]
MMGRQSERVLKEFKAQLILNRERHDVIIDDFSANGMKVRTEQTNTDVNFLPDKIVDLEFEIPSGEILNLNCKLIWSSKMSSDSLIQDIGLKLNEASPMYEEFFKSLFMDNMSFL